MCTVQRHGVKNVFDVGPRLMLFDGSDGIREKYIDGGLKKFYIIAHDGRMLTTDLNPNGASAVSLVEPNLIQGGGPGMTVCSRLIVFAKF